MLKGKNAIITGSTSGIGLGVAKKLAAAGVNITLNGFGDANEIEQIRSSIATEHKVTVRYDAADMSKPEQIRQMVKNAETELGSVDIIVNNAGIQNVQPIDEFDDAKWDAIIAINLSSNFHTIKAASAGMKARKWGRIINIASVHGLVASAYKSAYIAAKHGVVGLTKAVALDLAEFGITANAICPGYVNTPLVQKQIPDQAKTHGISEAEVVQKILLKNHAIKEFVEVDEIAAMVLFLCSDGAKTLTGTSLPIDAGWTAQ